MALPEDKFSQWAILGVILAASLSSAEFYQCFAHKAVHRGWLFAGLVGQRITTWRFFHVGLWERHVSICFQSTGDTAPFVRILGFLRDAGVNLDNKAIRLLALLREFRFILGLTAISLLIISQLLWLRLAANKIFRVSNTITRCAQPPPSSRSTVGFDRTLFSCSSLAYAVLARLSTFYCRLRLVWADGGYAGALVEWVSQLRSPQQRAPLQLEIVKRSDQSKGFVVLPKRWIVERTFGWLSRSRRLCKDYETQISHSQAMVLIAMSHLMLKRLHNKGNF